MYGIGNGETMRPAAPPFPIPCLPRPATPRPDAPGGPSGSGLTVLFADPSFHSFSDLVWASGRIRREPDPKGDLSGMSADHQTPALTSWLDGTAPGPAAGASAGRRSVAVQALALALVGAVLYLGAGRRTAGLVAWALALLVLAVGMASGPARRAMARFGGLVGRVVGQALSWLLLTPLYFLIFTPAALALRLAGRDPLRRRPRPAPATYWHARHGAARPDSYGRQFIVEERE